MISYLFILLLCILVVHIYAFEEVIDGENALEKVTILEWQYCEACKLTVDLYGELFFEQMSQFYKKGPKPDSMVNSSEIVSGMCDNPFFDQFQPFVKYGCIKTVEDSGVKFLQQFSGFANTLDVINKASSHRRRKEVCSCFDKCRIAVICFSIRFALSTLPRAPQRRSRKQTSPLKQGM